MGNPPPYTIHPRDADYHRDVDRYRDVDHHGARHIGTEFERKETEWTESKEHEPKTSERPL